MQSCQGCQYILNDCSWNSHLPPPQPRLANLPYCVVFYKCNELQGLLVCLRQSAEPTYLIPALGDLDLSHLHFLPDHSLPQSGQVQMQVISGAQLPADCIRRLSSTEDLLCTSGQLLRHRPIARELTCPRPYSQLGSNSGNFWKVAILSLGKGPHPPVSLDGTVACCTHL